MKSDRAELRIAEITMMGSHEHGRTTGRGAEFYYEQHWRTHKRWIATVLALYAGLVSIGVIATVVHRSMVTPSSGPAVEAPLATAER